jgi:hypothetical protein
VISQLTGVIPVLPDGDKSHIGPQMDARAPGGLLYLR